MLSLVLSACTTTSIDKLSAGDHYVNLGSSFSAGSGTGPVHPDAPKRCYRAITNHAALLAKRMSLSLNDQSCAGATSAHVLMPWGELPAQLDGIAPTTKLVTITVGGNDLNYVGNLYAAGCAEITSYTINGKTVQCGSKKPTQEADYVELENNYHEIFKQIRLRAPRARIIVVQYLTLISDLKCPAVPLAEADAAEALRTSARLRVILDRVALKNGVDILGVDKISKDHTPCHEVPWTVGFFKDRDNAYGWPWHPNARGMEVVAEQLYDLLNP